jgi:hypothetical protein
VSAKNNAELEAFQTRHDENLSSEGRHRYEREIAPGKKQILHGRVNHLPCPFCGAADWFVVKVVDFPAESANEHTCSECGRSAKFVDRIIVQTGGDPAPHWFAEVKPGDGRRLT